MYCYAEYGVSGWPSSSFLACLAWEIRALTKIFEQRHMRKVMRSALAQVKGLGEGQMRRREVLSLYRWTGDGTGIAL